MGHGNYSNQHHNQAADGLVNLLIKSNNDLALVQLKLEQEFKQVYPDHANPMKLVARIKKIQEEVGTLKLQCRELLAAKQDLIDKAQTTLVGNRNLVQKMQASMGIPVASVDEDPAFANFNQIIDEWTVQVRSRTGDEEQNSEAEDLNEILFSAVMQTEHS